MAREIERKFLLANENWKALAHKKTHFAQGYLNDISGDLATDSDEQNDKVCSKSSVRVRIEGDQANMNIKSLEIGLSRDEYEYPIALADAEKMLSTLAVGPVIEKYRYLVSIGQHTWEIDEFLGDNQGLVVAEVELQSENEAIELPDWLGREVTEEVRYYNISLSQRPFKLWSEDEKA